MSVYYFNVHDGDVTIDEEGSEMADLPSARACAVAGLRSLASAAISHGHLQLSDYIEIKDASQRGVGTVTFADAVVVRP